MNIDKKMRTIKFRAWDKKEKKMFDVCDLYLQTTNRYGVSFISGETFNAEDIELMQYTGLKDKNGKEIYEGDILDGGYVVEWETMEDNEMGFGVGIGFNVHPDIVEDSEVIGNIYENSKLIN